MDTATQTLALESIDYSAAEFCGDIDGIVFANDDTGWACIELRGHRATGPLASLAEGQRVTLRGRWEDHPRYGRGFKADSFNVETPTSSRGLAAFLASDRFFGLGPILADRIVNTFGTGTGDVIETDPSRLAGVRGISAQMAEQVGVAWQKVKHEARIIQALTAVDVPGKVANRAVRMFPMEDLQAILRDDPYQLLRVQGVDWRHVERLGRNAGIGLDDYRRLRAGALQAQRQIVWDAQHVGVPAKLLGRATMELLGGSHTDKAVRAAVDAGLLVFDRDVFYTPQDHHAEQGIANHLTKLARTDSDVAAEFGEWEPDDDSPLTNEQAEAVRNALTHAVSVLTGGPGTGKTFTIKTVVDAALDAGLTVGLCAPTGRAARRMTETIDVEAHTIHRFLEYAPGHGFTRDADNPLPHDLVIVDEWSMADNSLAHSLIQAVRPGAHLVMVGDPDQLPSVGAGAVLRDMLDRQSGIPTVRLTKIHRQAEASRIITLAHEVNAGKLAPADGAVDRDLVLAPEYGGAIPRRVTSIVKTGAPEFFGVDSSDVQVLAPMKKGEAGTHGLNETLREALNPPRGRTAVCGFLDGDRVIQTKNNYDLGVSNGDVGTVVAVVRDPEAKPGKDMGADRRVHVEYPHATVIYEPDDTEHLQHAWAMTVHKSQGGEWPVVVVVLSQRHRRMHYRELLYTAITRAAKGLVLVGDLSCVPNAAARVDGGGRQRITKLTDRLRDASAMFDDANPKGGDT